MVLAAFRVFLRAFAVWAAAHAGLPHRGLPAGSRLTRPAFGRRANGARTYWGVVILLGAGQLALAGCAGMSRTPPSIGDPLDTVVAKFGRPTAIYPLEGGQVLEYASGPMGQYTWMARIGADRRLQAFEQVLSANGFGKVKIGQFTKDDVLRTLGRPSEVSRVAFQDYEVWSYRYKEADVWNSMMHVHFDRAGIVRQMLNGPDREYEERPFFR